MSFNVYVREDEMGGQPFIEERFESAEAAESFAFRTLTRVLAEEHYPVTVTIDGGLGDGEEDVWGGEIVLSCDMLWDEDVRMVLVVEDF